MKQPRLYTPENLRRMKHGQLVVGLIVLVVCGYLIFGTFGSLRGVWRTRRLISAANKESANTSRIAAKMVKQETGKPPVTDGGLDSFALCLSRLAREQSVSIESMDPEGASEGQEITVGDVKLGKWQAEKVRVTGAAGFVSFAALIHRLQNPQMPFRLDSFALRADRGDSDGSVTFDLVLTVYEKVNGES